MFCFRAFYTHENTLRHALDYRVYVCIDRKTKIIFLLCKWLLLFYCPNILKSSRTALVFLFVRIFLAALIFFSWWMKKDLLNAHESTLACLVVRSSFIISVDITSYLITFASHYNQQRSEKIAHAVKKAKHVKRLCFVNLLWIGALMRYIPIVARNTFFSFLKCVCVMLSLSHFKLAPDKICHDGIDGKSNFRILTCVWNPNETSIHCVKICTNWMKQNREAMNRIIHHIHWQESRFFLILLLRREKCTNDPIKANVNIGNLSVKW